MDLKLIQFHQYTISQVKEVEFFDDWDVLRQGGGDGGQPPSEDDIYGPGPTIESIHGDDDPADIPVPAGDTDSDLEDDAFWVKWLEEIRADECPITEKHMVTTEARQPQRGAGEEPMAPRLPREGLGNHTSVTTTTIYGLHGNPIQLSNWNYSIGNPQATTQLSILSFTLIFQAG